MTIINNSHRFVFVHIPKCGGTSMTTSLSGLTNYCDLEIGSTQYGEEFQKIFSPRFGIYKHSYASEIRAVLGRKAWASLFSFALVRNPYRRAFSTFSYFKKHDFAYDFIKKFETFNEYVESDQWENPGPDRILLPQSNWLTTGSNRELIVDQVIKLETAASELENVLDIIDPRRVKTRQVALIHKNESTKGKPFPPISDLAREKIINRYTSDFELFDYDTSCP